MISVINHLNSDINRVRYAAYASTSSFSTVMGASEELDYLKSLVSQLNAKIAAIEAKPKVPPTPAQQLRTILMGPPGAGIFLSVILRRNLKYKLFI